MGKIKRNLEKEIVKNVRRIIWYKTYQGTLGDMGKIKIIGKREILEKKEKSEDL